MSILVGFLTTKNKLKLPQSREFTKKNQIQKTLIISIQMCQKQQF